MCVYELLNCKIYCYLFLINIIYSLLISNVYTMHYDCPHHPSSSVFLLLSSNTFLQKFFPGTLMSFSFVSCPAEFNQDCDVGNPSGSGWAGKSKQVLSHYRAVCWQWCEIIQWRLVDSPPYVLLKTMTLFLLHIYQEPRAPWEVWTHEYTPTPTIFLSDFWVIMQQKEDRK